jgi:2-polyprenyl-3-methyl-5-hydroxy-6-metoxy-1,4-benzoquinol methylase
MTADDTVYANRFAAQENTREGVWIEIARHLQRYVPTDSAVLDIAADKGHFIRNIVAREKWASDLRDTSSAMTSDVHFVQADGLKLDEFAPNDHFDRIFMSNYLEHLPNSDAVVEQLRVARKLLKVGGQVIVLQPNIRLVGGSYWDFIDHRTALTERSLAEGAVAGGLNPITMVPRFLPYSTKGRLPQGRALVRAYLAFPLAWRFMGKQTLMIAERNA